MPILLFTLPDVTDTSTVPDQGNSTTITSSPDSGNEPRVASEGCSSRCEVDMYLLISHTINL